MKIKLVLNVTFGGFHLDDEMAEWLRNNKGWRLGDSSDYKYENSDIIGSNNFWLPKNHNSFELRSNPDLIECIEKLQEKYNTKDLNFIKVQQIKNSNISSLQIIEYEIDIDVCDYHDGKEKIEVFHTRV